MSASSLPSADPAAFLPGGGETGALLRQFDWASTPLGPISHWPPCLRTAAGIVLRSPVPMVMLWGESGVMIYNDAYSVFAGRRHPALFGSNVREGWAEVADFNDHVMKVGLAGGTLAFCDQELTLYRNGRAEQVWMNLDYSPVLDEQGAPAGVLSIVIETTARVMAERLQRSAEAANRESAARLRRVLENMGEAFILLDDAFRVLEINVEALKLDGRPAEDILGLTYGEAWPKEDAGPIGEALREAAARETLVEIEHRYTPPDGRPRWLELRAYPATPGLAVFVRDVDARKQAEDALRLSEERFRAITNSVDQMIWSTLPDGYHDFYNQRWYDFTGAPDGSTDGDGWNGMFHPEDQARAAARWQHSLTSGEPYHIEYRLRHHSGDYRWVIGRAQPMRDARGAIARWYGTCTDIHDLKQAEDALRELNATLEERVRQAILERQHAEEALRQAQKMEAVGQLTGGIAHDFNNLLTVVTGNIDMGTRALDAAGVADPRARRAFDNAMKGAERAAALTQRLLAFSRRQPLAPKSLDVDKLVQGMSDLLNRSLGETVQLEIVTSPGLWRVEADPNQLEAAVLNLAVNARDAMPGGGNLMIETANARLDEEYCASYAEVSPGQYVVIAVTDTGEGMSRETIGRVFEPFYTTKEVGKGTGLGLSMVYGFVKQSGGHIKIYSEESQGTTVKIYLPRLMSDTVPEEEATLNTGLEASPRSETILVAEDDDDVRAYTVECLRELGYRVLEAHDGPSALRLMKRQDHDLDLLFSDVVMPGMSGRELGDAARGLQPKLRILYTSGYTRNAIAHGGRLDPGVEMIAKPFTYAALAQKVRDVLDFGRTGRVLVVEDEATVRTLAAEALGTSGYAAEEAANATEALSKVRSAQGRYDVVFIDHGLPDRTGEALAIELRTLHADLPILLTSGEHEDRLRRVFAGDRCTAVISKPYTSAKLNEALRALGLRCHAAHRDAPAERAGAQ